MAALSVFFERLENAIHRLAQSEPDAAHTGALLWLLRNLQAIDAQLASIETEQAQAVDPQHSDNLLSREELSGWSDIKLRLSLHLSPASALFRHAVRMSIVMCVGYGFIQITGLERGYWILLTSLFVCQPNYSATQRRLALRIGGTLAGIALGLPLLWLVPSIEGQLVLIVVTGVMFFAFRQVQYAHATLFITLLVLFCFNLLGEGFEVALPRVVDTLLGCALAWLAVTFIWPDWRFRQLPAVATRTLNANCRYLDAIMEQYHQGKDNRLAYRIARRDAHNADAELASVVSNMSSETRTNPKLRESAFQLLCLNHSLLSYISALGRTAIKSLIQRCWHFSTTRCAMSKMCCKPTSSVTAGLRKCVGNWNNALPGLPPGLIRLRRWYCSNWGYWLPCCRKSLACGVL